MKRVRYWSRNMILRKDGEVTFTNCLMKDMGLLQSDRLKTRGEDQNSTFYRRIQEFEVKEALKRMENAKVVGPNNIPIEVCKCLGGKGISWLTKLFNEILRSKNTPDE